MIYFLKRSTHVDHNQLDIPLSNFVLVLKLQIVTQIHNIGIYDFNGKGESNWLWSTSVQSTVIFIRSIQYSLPEEKAFLAEPRNVVHSSFFLIVQNYYIDSELLQTTC